MKDTEIMIDGRDATTEEAVDLPEINFIANPVFEGQNEDELIKEIKVAVREN